MHSLIRRALTRVTSASVAPLRPSSTLPSRCTSAFLRIRLPLGCASLHSSPARHTFTYPSSRTLDEIVKLPLLIPHTREEIIHIWTTHHALVRNAATTSDTLNAKEYETFQAAAKKAPLFVVPCFRLSNSQPAPGEPYTFDINAGFEMMLVNVQQSALLLTSLEEYKSKGASAATPYAVITLYADMIQSKDLVLVRSEMMDVNVVIPQLQQLWSLIKEFYIHSPSAFAQFPENFNRKPNPTFDFDAYITQCKKLVKEMKFEQKKLGHEGEQEQAAELIPDAEIETRRPSNTSDKK